MAEISGAVLPMEFMVEQPEGSPSATPDLKRKRSGSTEPSSRKGKGKDSAGSEQSPWKTSSKKKGQTLEEEYRMGEGVEEESPEEVGNSEEEEKEAPFTELKKRLGMGLRSSTRKPPAIYHSPVAPNRTGKSPTQEGSG